MKKRFNFTLEMPLVLILGAFFGLCLIYAWATPPLEASDELWHVGMIDYIASTGQLPVQQAGLDTPYAQEGSQPPLYYLISALLVSGMDRSDFNHLREANPHAIAGVPGNWGNKNLVLHDAVVAPLEGSRLVVYVVRLLSILCGCVTVAAVYTVARGLGGSSSPLLPVVAASITAFNPMFVFISASVNNDNLVTALNSLVIWQLVLLVQNSRFTWRHSTALAILVALASLSKLSGLVLVPFVLLTGVWIFVRPLIRRRLGAETASPVLNWRGLAVFVGLIGIVWLLVAGWWYWRNWALYGELFGTRMMAAVAGPRIEPFSLQTLVNEFQGFRFAYWALFGAVNVMTFRWFYDVMDMLTLLSIAGIVIGTGISLRARRWREGAWLDKGFLLLMLGLVVGTGLISVAAWTSQTYASQGRLLFPFNTAISLLGAIGILAFGRYVLFAQLYFGKWLRSGAYFSLTVLMAAFALVVPFASIRPVYTPPKPIVELPTNVRHVYAAFGDVALVGYAVDDRRYHPGDAVPITLYWQVLKRSTIDYSLYLHATLDDGRVIGKVDSYPGAGLLRTSQWDTGAIYPDTYLIELDDSANSVSRLRVQVGWWDFMSGSIILAADQNSQRLSSVMLDAGGFAPPNTQQQIDRFVVGDGVHFGDTVSLQGYRLDGNVVTLLWRALRPFSADYTVFVQALDKDNVVIGQGDAPPNLPTRYWQVGEQFISRHVIVAEQSVKAGAYRILVGWYNPLDLARLPADYPDRAYPLPDTLSLP